MKPSDREVVNTDFLGGSFVTIPHLWLTQITALDLNPAEFLILVQILSSSQVEHKDFLTPQELSDVCNLSAHTVSDLIGGLVRRGLLAIGERYDYNGTHTNYFDLTPLWVRLHGKDTQQDRTRQYKRDVVSLFEDEFGRPLSGLECEQIRQWMTEDGHPDWMLIEALREAVLANKYSFKYIDRILYDWQRNRVRTKQELEAYRQTYRDRNKAREETAATTVNAQATLKPPARQGRPKTPEVNRRDERYSAFYQLFPDT